MSTRSLVFVFLIALICVGLHFAANSIGQRRAAAYRQAVFAAMQPVALSNCNLKRFGSARDGGYWLCENLVRDARAVYSYGINNNDDFGCEVATRYRLPLHQYDCFDVRRPACGSAPGVSFHAECVGARAETIDGRPFDTVPRQLEKNADAGKALILKMDVEGAEWKSLLATPDDVLAGVEQLIMEFHHPQDPSALAVMQKLGRTFHFVHLHQNNWACKPGLEPFPAEAFEMLLVNKRLGVVDPSARAVLSDPRDLPNNPDAPDCQLTPAP